MKNLIILFFLFLILVSCSEKRKEVINMLPKEVYTEYNPVALSQSCKEAQTVRILIPKPRLFLTPPGTTDTTFQILTVSIEDVYSEELKISNDFTFMEEGKRKKRNKKYFEFKMPSHRVLGKSEGIMDIELFFNNKLMDDYSVNFQFIEDDQEIEVVKKTGTTLVKSSRESVKDKSYDFRIKESGQYHDDVKYSYIVKKTKENFEVTTKGLGGKIYKVDKSKKKRLVATIPESKELKTYVPLNFELEEINKESGRPGNVVLKNKDIGQIPGYVHNFDLVGANQKIKFNNCSKTIISEDEIYLPLISSWAPIEK